MKTNEALAKITGCFDVKDAIKARGWKWITEEKAWSKVGAWSSVEDVEAEVRRYAGVRNRRIGTSRRGKHSSEMEIMTTQKQTKTINVARCEKCGREEKRLTPWPDRPCPRCHGPFIIDRWVRTTEAGR